MLVSDAANHGSYDDSDVLVLAIAAVQKLDSSGRYLPAHEMAHALVQRSALPCPSCMHSGCDTVSSFAGRGKRTVWEIWKTFIEVTPAFCSIASTSSLLMINSRYWSAL